MTFSHQLKCYLYFVLPRVYLIMYRAPVARKRDSINARDEEDNNKFDYNAGQQKAEDSFHRNKASRQ